MEKSGTTHHSEGREMITIPFLDQPLSQQSSDNKSCNTACVRYPEESRVSDRQLQ